MSTAHHALSGLLLLTACTPNARQGESPTTSREAAPKSGVTADGSTIPPHDTTLDDHVQPSASAEASPTNDTATAQSATTPQPAPDPSPPADMLLVLGGTFVMGADDEGEMDERPAHSVRVAPVFLDELEVSNQQYLECVDAKVCRMYAPLTDSKLTNGMTHVFHRPDHPVVGVSWDDAKTYCEWRGKRLPREAEWERAVRGDDNRRYPWGNDAPDPKKHGAFQFRGTTAPVGSFPEGNGPYGHLDLAGNVWEWIADHYDPYAYQRPTAGDGIPGSCEEILAAQDELRKAGKQGYTGTNPIPNECEHVLRGGAYNYRSDGLRNSNRVHHPARFRIAVAGFRCAKDVTSTAPR